MYSILLHKKGNENEIKNGNSCNVERNTFMYCWIWFIFIWWCTHFLTHERLLNANCKSASIIAMRWNSFAKSLTGLVLFLFWFRVVGGDGPDCFEDEVYRKPRIIYEGKSHLDKKHYSFPIALKSNTRLLQCIKCILYVNVCIQYIYM